MSKMSCQCKDHNYRTNLISPQLSTEFDRNALPTLENYGGYNNRFYGGFSANAENIRLGG